MAERQTNKERLKEITDGIEQGIKDLFESDRYRQYLSVMSRFHRYSVNNTMLIYMQKPDASLVAGFQKWKNQFGRHVKKGERGITIIAPTPFKKKVEEVKLDPDTKAPLLDPDGKQITEEKEVSIPMFKPVKVFDVSQTDGRPLPHLASTLTGSVEQYEIFVEALRRSAPVPISFQAISPDTDGYFSPTDQAITIREGMSEVQTISALVHEITHSKLHNNVVPDPGDTEKFQEVEIFDIPALFSNGRIAQDRVPDGMYRYDLRGGKDDDPGMPSAVELSVVVNHAGSIITTKPLSIPENGFLELTDDEGLNFVGGEVTISEFKKMNQKDRRTEEVEAESVSYAVCQYFGIETGENSFGYIASWSQGKELKELRASLETINKTASELITDVDRNFAEICKERGIDPKALPELEQAVPELETQAPDAYQLYATDLCDHLDRLSQEGLLENQFTSMSKEDMAVAYADILRHGGFNGARTILADAAERSGVPTPDALLTRLEALSDQWDKGLTYQMEQNVLQEGQSYVLAFEGETSHGIIFAGPTNVCEKLLTELKDGTMTARQARAMHQQWEEAEQEAPLGDPEALYLLDKEKIVHIQATDEGFDYTLYDADSMKAIDGGQFSVDGAKIHPAETLMDGAFKEVCVLQGMEPAQVEPIPLEKLDEIMEANAIQPSPELQMEAPTKDDLPDPTITPRMMDRYGYADQDMLPLSKDRALELAERDVTIYMIYHNGTAEMAFDTEEIAGHDGIFGVSREEWESIKTEIPPRDVEKRFLEKPGDALLIYQLNDTAPRERLFTEYSGLDTPPQREHYNAVYTADLNIPAGANISLDSVYEEYNLHRPEDFTGHSLSVSDIVAIKQGGEVSYHYCDSFGFKELPGFNQPENYLKSAEMAMEDDYGMIDGIINNGPKQPTVAELEAQVNAGQTISLMDLAAAVKAEQKERPRSRATKGKEEKPSILDRLKQPAPERKNKTAPQRSAERELI